LFYTSIRQPETILSLRSYILHRLFSRVTHESSTVFPFLKRAQIVERDSVLVPAGWDSKGKISALNDGFKFEYAERENYENIIKNLDRDKVKKNLFWIF